MTALQLIVGWFQWGHHSKLAGVHTHTKECGKVDPLWTPFTGGGCMRLCLSCSKEKGLAKKTTERSSGDWKWQNAPESASFVLWARYHVIAVLPKRPPVPSVPPRPPLPPNSFENTPVVEGGGGGWGGDCPARIKRHASTQLTTAPDMLVTYNSPLICGSGQNWLYSRTCSLGNCMVCSATGHHKLRNSFGETSVVVVVVVAGFFSRGFIT